MIASDAKSVFLAAVEIDSPAQRQAYLDAECGGDDALRCEVEQLLAHHARLGEFLEAPATVVAKVADTICRPAAAPNLSFLAPPSQPSSLGRLAHYEILELVGWGGFGIVLKARDEKLERTVAIKTLADLSQATPEFRQRFLREARAAAAIRSDHVVAIHAVDEIDGRPIIVMEFIAGQSLAERMADGPLPADEVVRIGSQIAAGLVAAHAMGFVHRDVKPANILLEASTGRVKLTDFGLARAMDDAAASRESVIAGTPQYMSPEQARGEAVDHRTDLFSLGSVLFAMIAGRPPFAAEGSLATLRRLCDETPPLLDEVSPGTPPALAELVRRLLSKRPENRPQSAFEVQSLLADPRLLAPQPRTVAGPISRRHVLLATGVALAAGAAILGVSQWPVRERAATAPFDVERLLAERVQTLGGELMLSVGDSELRLTCTDPLPNEPFHVVRAGLGNQTYLTPTDLQLVGRLTRLRILELGGTNVTDDDLVHLGGLHGLEDLDLSGTEISDRGVAHLSPIRSLYVLHLSGTRVTGESLAFVGANRNLARLYLQDTAVGDAALPHLLPLKSLLTLDLSGTAVTDSGLATLAALRQLEELRLEGTQTTKAGVESLQRELPACLIRH
jgi:serine/threonine protein kinase